MTSTRRPWPGARLPLLLALLAFAGCATRAPPLATDGPEARPPPGLLQAPDAVPVLEPIRAGGPNKPYTVLGRTYTPLSADAPLSEQGLASWYGRRFHGRRTASGEVYDMYAMTAAHRTLPLPSFARVTNPANGRLGQMVRKFLLAGRFGMALECAEDAIKLDPDNLMLHAVSAQAMMFVGRNDGRLTALNSDTGLKLWEFQTGAGMNSTVSSFERDGKQYVVAYSAGNVLGGTTKGDSVWLFALGNWIGELALHRTTERRFRIVFQVVLTLLGLRLLWSAAPAMGWS